MSHVNPAPTAPVLDSLSDAQIVTTEPGDPPPLPPLEQVSCTRVISQAWTRRPSSGSSQNLRTKLEPYPASYGPVGRVDAKQPLPTMSSSQNSLEASPTKDELKLVISSLQNVAQEATSTLARREREWTDAAREFEVTARDVTQVEIAEEANRARQAVSKAQQIEDLAKTKVMAVSQNANIEKLQMQDILSHEARQTMIARQEMSQEMLDKQKLSLAREAYLETELVQQLEMRQQARMGKFETDLHNQADQRANEVVKIMQSKFDQETLQRNEALNETRMMQMRLEQASSDQQTMQTKLCTSQQEVSHYQNQAFQTHQALQVFQQQSQSLQSQLVNQVPKVPIETSPESMDVSDFTLSDSPTMKSEALYRSEPPTSRNLEGEIRTAGTSSLHDVPHQPDFEYALKIAELESELYKEREQSESLRVSEQSHMQSKEDMKLAAEDLRQQVLQQQKQIHDLSSVRRPLSPTRVRIHSPRMPRPKSRPKSRSKSRAKSVPKQRAKPARSRSPSASRRKQEKAKAEESDKNTEDNKVSKTTDEELFERSATSGREL